MVEAPFPHRNIEGGTLFENRFGKNNNPFAEPFGRDTACRVRRDPRRNQAISQGYSQKCPPSTFAKGGVFPLPENAILARNANPIHYPA
jgi:hypothetical protein